MSAERACCRDGVALRVEVLLEASRLGHSREGSATRTYHKGMTAELLACHGGVDAKAHDTWHRIVNKRKDHDASRTYPQVERDLICDLALVLRKKHLLPEPPSNHAPESR